MSCHSVLFNILSVNVNVINATKSKHNFYSTLSLSNLVSKILFSFLDKGLEEEDVPVPLSPDPSFSAMLTLGKDGESQGFPFMDFINLRTSMGNYCCCISP